MWYNVNPANPEIKFFSCSGYNARNKICTSRHYIRVDFLEKAILQEIRLLTKFATQYEDEFAKIVMGNSKKAVERDRNAKKKELKALIARDKELDILFNRMWEDHGSGKIDDSRFARMSKQYNEEQAETAERIKVLRVEVEKADDKTVTSDKSLSQLQNVRYLRCIFRVTALRLNRGRQPTQSPRLVPQKISSQILRGFSIGTAIFLKTVRNYTRAKELTPMMLNEFIEKIEVHEAEKSSGRHVQALTIHYNCIGTIEIPDLEKLPEIDLTMHIRQGVELTYVPGKKTA
jgi:hypothetical protein